MSAQRSISVTYDLHPPTGISPPLPSSSSTATAPTEPIATSSRTNYPINPPSSDSGSASETSRYYTALSQTLQTAQLELNERLTGWKDAIGDKEKMKEDPGTPGFGRGKAAMMSEGVTLDDQGDGSEDEDEESGFENEGEVA